MLTYLTPRSKRVIELGSGYRLAGLVIAATSEASEVIISDGNPQVVDCIPQTVTWCDMIVLIILLINFINSIVDL